jgi:tRNA dimethylallyltransferase
MSTLNKLIVILGPTASGKSEIALKLAQKFNGEIISADSRQIYKEMIIATASLFTQIKKSKIKLKNDSIKYKNKIIKVAVIDNIPHHLLHFIKPDENFSVAEYKELAVKIIRDIQNRGKIPILAGGTGLYISSIVDNIEIPKVKPDSKLRKKLEKTSPAALLKQLKKLDPVTFKIIDKKNTRRIIRALEVTISVDKPFSELKTKGAPLFNCLQLGLDVPREKLNKKIDQRVEKMFKLGLIKETKKLAKKYSQKLSSMSGIGYKQACMYLRDEITLAQTKDLIKIATHQYAKRQFTWFKRDKNIRWIKNFKQASKLLTRFNKH